MAYVDRIWIRNSDKEKGCATAYVKLSPAGEVAVKFTMPEGFHNCILAMAQEAGDLHEQQMRAEILADTIKETK